MRIGRSAVAVCAAVCLQAGMAYAQSRSLTLANVLARAREQAPQIVSARLALEEARGRLLGASLRFQTNPEIDAALGNRNGPGTRFTDFEVGLGQSFEPGARRSARIAGASAAIAQGSANVDEVTRTILRVAASAYYRAVHANERIKLLNATHELAASVHAIADRRFKAGDAEASKALALGNLRQLLRLENDIGVDGSLTRPGDTDLDAALQTASQRPEIRGLEAAIEEAEAELRQGLSFSKPAYGVGVRYSREALLAWIAQISRGARAGDAGCSRQAGSPCPRRPGPWLSWESRIMSAVL